MNTPKKKRKMVPMYSAADFFSGKKDAKPVGWMSDPDEPGPVVLDRESWKKLMGITSSGKGPEMVGRDHRARRMVGRGVPPSRRKSRFPV